MSCCARRRRVVFFLLLLVSLVLWLSTTRCGQAARLLDEADYSSSPDTTKKLGKRDPVDCWVDNNGEQHCEQRTPVTEGDPPGKPTPGPFRCTIGGCPPP
ncbi:hypothetical protein OPV22_027626 [Ensete ventricosum]|uniref:Uncharacterized protein n=1 Tax=Ensete ventricosum TaxID=4639 RepID=A0AAV8Q0N6_ENSVE|nr:hypothetical protein OPV22_027626 [Ensete ventricosum]